MSESTCVCNGCTDKCDPAGGCKKWTAYYDEVEGNVEYPDRIVGEIITDCEGTELKRTNRRDMESTYPDNYYYMPMECYCDVDYDGGGYTFNDEYGLCDHCDNKIRQTYGHNDSIDVDFDDETLFSTDEGV